MKHYISINLKIFEYEYEFIIFLLLSIEFKNFVDWNQYN